MQSAIIPIGLKTEQGLRKHKSKTDILRKEAIRFVDEQWKPEIIKDKILRNMMKTEYVRRFRLEIEHKTKRNRKNKILVDKFLKRHKTTLKGLSYKQYISLLKQVKMKRKTKRGKRRRGRCTRRIR